MKKYTSFFLIIGLVYLLPGPVSSETPRDNYLQRKPSAKDLVLALSPQPTLKFRGIEVQPDTQKVILDIKFEFDSTQLTKESITLLQTLGEALTSEELKRSSFAIVGHTDETGTEDYNQKLSVLRALAVKEFLTKHHNIPQKLLYTEGKGESNLLYPDDPDNRDNRRVEVINLGIL